MNNFCVLTEFQTTTKLWKSVFKVFYILFHFSLQILNWKMTAKDVSQVMYEKLKCQVCETGPTAGKSQWYRCLSHHQICQDCKTAELTKCPCGRMISSDHCSLNEELLKLTTMRFKCKNTKNGCKETLGEEAMISHQIDCIYRLVECPCIICKSKVPFFELLDQLDQRKASHIGGVYEFSDLT